MRNFMEYAKLKNLGKPIFFIDYFQYIGSSGNQLNADYRARANQAAFALNTFANEYRTAVVCLSFISRGNYNNKNTETAAKDSGEIDFTATNNFELRYINQGNKDFDLNEAKSRDPRTIELVIHKNRSGRGIGYSINYFYHPKSNIWYEVNYRHGPTNPRDDDPNQSNNDNSKGYDSYAEESIRDRVAAMLENAATMR